MRKAMFLVAMLSALGASAGDSFVLTSINFLDGRNIPVKHTKSKILGGRNISPSLAWKNPPKGTKSFVLACVDTNPIAKRWVHWVVVNIPASVKRLKQGASPKAIPQGAVELKNSFGVAGWGGPKPPRGTGVHKYVFTLYALDVADLGIPKGTFLSRADLIAKLKGHILAKAVLTGLYER